MHTEKECYQCGKMKTILNYRGRCLTCETQRSDFNNYENENLRHELAKLAVERDALQRLITECTVDGELDSRLFNAYFKSVVMCLSEDVKRALTDSRNLAMTNTAKARVPECGDFGFIAQSLDFICEQLGLNT